MIKRILTLMCVFSALMASAQTGWKVVSEGLRFCESTYPYEGGNSDCQFWNGATESAEH